MLPLLIPAALGLAAEFAPGLVRALAGNKAGEVADQVVGVARRVTGQEEPDAAAAALRADPALALEYKRQMASYELELERLHLADVADARARDVRMTELGRTNWRAHLMILGAFAMLIFSVYLVATVDMSETVRAMLNTIASGCLALLGLAFNFEFGSSRGSKDKDARLALPR